MSTLDRIFNNLDEIKFNIRKAKDAKGRALPSTVKEQQTGLKGAARTRLARQIADDESTRTTEGRGGSKGAVFQGERKTDNVSDDSTKVRERPPSGIKGRKTDTKVVSAKDYFDAQRKQFNANNKKKKEAALAKLKEETKKKIARANNRKMTDAEKKAKAKRLAEQKKRRASARKYSTLMGLSTTAAVAGEKARRDNRRVTSRGSGKGFSSEGADKYGTRARAIAIRNAKKKIKTKSFGERLIEVLDVIKAKDAKGRALPSGTYYHEPDPDQTKEGQATNIRGQYDSKDEFDGLHPRSREDYKKLSNSKISHVYDEENKAPYNPKKSLDELSGYISGMLQVAKREAGFKTRVTGVNLDTKMRHGKDEGTGKRTVKEVKTGNRYNLQSRIGDAAEKSLSGSFNSLLDAYQYRWFNKAKDFMGNETGKVTESAYGKGKKRGADMNKKPKAIGESKEDQKVMQS